MVLNIFKIPKSLGWRWNLLILFDQGATWVTGATWSTWPQGATGEQGPQGATWPINCSTNGQIFKMGYRLTRMWY